MIGIIVQARTKSTRFPRKIFAEIGEKYTLQRVLDGVTGSKLAHKIILAMPDYDRDEITERVKSGELNKYVGHRGFSVYCGDPDDLVKRYYDAAGINGLDLIVRVTADCPLIQPGIIDEMLNTYLKNGYNGYMYNRLDPTFNNVYSDGLDVEIFPWWMLVDTMKNATSKSDREHVTLFMKREHRVYSFANAEPNTVITTKHPDFSFDTEEDYELIQKIAVEYDRLGDLNKALESV